MIFLKDGKLLLKTDLTKKDYFITKDNKAKFFDTHKNNKTLFWFDTETSGLDSKKNQVLTIAFVASDIYFNVRTKIYLKIKPIEGKIIEESAMKINKLDITSEEYLKDALTEVEALDKVKNFILENKNEYNIFFGQNVKFDKGFLEDMIVRNNYENFLASNSIIDSLPFFKKLVNEAKIKTKQLIDKRGQPYFSTRLEDLAESLDCKVGDSHNSLGDTLTLIECYKKATKINENKDYFTVYTSRYDVFKNFKELFSSRGIQEVLLLLNNNLELTENLVADDSLSVQQCNFCLKCLTVKKEKDCDKCFCENLNSLIIEEFKVIFDLDQKKWQKIESL